MRLTQQQLQAMREQLQHLKGRHVAESLVGNLGHIMSLHICAGTVQVSAHRDQLPLQGHFRVDDNESKLIEIKAKKDEIKKQLETIAKEEQQLKQAKLSQSKVSAPVQYFKSELTPEDIEKIRKIKQEERKFQKHLMEKTQQYEQRIKKFKQQEEALKEKQRKQKYQLKKQEIQKTIELIQKRKQEREMRRDQEKKLMKEIRERKKLHEEWEEKWKSVEEEEQRKKEELKEELKRMKKITHEQIKQHQKKYQESMKAHRQSRMRQSIVSGNDIHAISYRSIFLEQIRQQEKKQKQLEESKKGASREFLSKIKEYGEKVKTYHKPIIKPKEEPQQKSDDQSSKNERSMSLFQTHQTGNEYMRIANTRTVEAMKKKEQNSSTQVAQPEPPKYKNYLKELKKSDSEQEHKKTSELGEIRQILGKQNWSEEQKFQQAKLLAEKMENRTGGRSPQSIVNSINAKIEILRRVNI